MAEERLVSRAATAAWLKLHPGVELSHPAREVPHIELPALSLPRLAIDKLKADRARRRMGPEAPWITEDAVALLSTLVRPTDEGLEFGAGGSTIWFARRCALVRSVDGFKYWHDRLAARIAELGITNISLTLAPAEQLGYETDAHRDAYVNAFPELERESQDWVFVDGEFRDETALRGLELLKPGGLLVIDNINYGLPLPPHSRTKWKVSKPASPLWEEFGDRVRNWRMVWTTNGVWDTAMWFKT
jgi:predicted O-methyltransferase YrrM